MALFDVAVIGGGPAGSTAARLLAAGGVRVCVLDKARFPRPKACGGALSPRTLRYLPSGVDPLIRARIRRAVFTLSSHRPFEVVSPTPMAYMICREEFDTWLLEEASRAGAVVRQSEAVVGVEECPPAFHVRTAGGSLTASSIIGADGVLGVIARAFFSGRPPARYAALESEPVSNGGTDETVQVDVGPYPGGYAWAFPKGDRLNVGVMVDRGVARDARQLLGSFVGQHPIFPRPARVRGAFVAAPATAPVPCARAGVLLVGDAAQLADPFLGEGIYSAVRSATLAAQAILGSQSPRAAANAYGNEVARTLWPDLVAASRIAFLFHRMPRWWHHVLSRMPGALRQVTAVLGGEDTYVGLLRRTLAEIESRAGDWIRHRLDLRPGAWPAAAGEE